MMYDGALHPNGYVISGNLSAAPRAKKVPLGMSWLSLAGAIGTALRLRCHAGG
jgi:hypothetical protein